MTAELPGPVPPGTGWPEDPATPGTPVAHNAAEVVGLAASAPTLAELTARQSVCRACPRLVAWREQLAVERRKSFRTERYWGRPIPGWGSDEPRVLIVGLAPAAHGGNRTGRIFTGDRSGDFLYAALYRCGLAAKPDSVTAGDGQRLIGARMVASVRCAPPDNKPTPVERLTCQAWLSTEMAMVADSVRVLVCLGGFAWQALWPALAATGFVVPRPRPAFGHGVEVLLDRIPQSPGTPAQTGTAPAETAAGPTAAGPTALAASAEAAGAGAGERRPVLLLGCYHPSQQNTFTGRVTPSMLDAVLTRAVTYAK